MTAVRLSSEAQRHIDEIYRFIGERNTIAALGVVARIKAATDLLADFPQMGHEGTAQGTLELVVKGTPYIIVYELRSRRKEVGVLAILHGARER